MLAVLLYRVRDENTSAATVHAKTRLGTTWTWTRKLPLSIDPQFAEATSHHHPGA
jgi:hypothetical protein